MRRGFTLLEALTAMSVILCVLCLTAPAVQRSRLANAQTDCRNNLKQIGLAMHNYHDTYSGFPPAWTAHDYRPHTDFRTGWQFSILPFIDQAPLFEQLRESYEYDDGDVPTELLTTVVQTYRCPADPTPERNPFRGKLGTSNYSGNFGTAAPPRLVPGRLSASWPGHAETPRRTDGILWCNSICRMRDITDGTSNTLMVGERCFSSRAGIWPGVGSSHLEGDAVTDVSHANRLGHGLNSFSSVHGTPGNRGVQFVICDGSVRMIAQTIDSSGDGRFSGTLQRIGSRNDGNPIGDF